MGYYNDFAIKFDPEKDTDADLVERMFYSLFINRIKAHYPCIIFVAGKSGSGKSYSAIKLQEILLKMQGVEAHQHFEIINVMTPLEYPQKIDKLLFDKSLKKVNVMAIHEARTIVKSSQWHSFIAQTVGDLNAMSRQIKRMITIIVSQSIKDITVDVRRTINFYITVTRPRHAAARLNIKTTWLNDRDIEKPILATRKIGGYVIYPNGKRKFWMPSYIALRQPSKALRKKFNEMDRTSKGAIIRGKLEKLLQAIQEDIGIIGDVVESAYDHYTKNEEMLETIGKWKSKKWRINKDVAALHNFTKVQTKVFEEKITDHLKKQLEKHKELYGGLEDAEV